jgi:signal transduction histidine kinase
MGGEGGHPGRARWRWPRRELSVFVLVALLALVSVAAATVLLSDRIARSTALAEAERSTARLGANLVAPALADSLAGVPGRQQDLDRLVDNRMADGMLVELVVWAADGRVVYAHDPDLVGEQVPVPLEVTAAIQRRETTSGIETSPEARRPATPGAQLLEVYVPLTVAGQPPLALEAYYRADAVARQASLLRWQIIPMAVGALVLLQLVQVPIAASLGRRVARHEAERAELLGRLLSSSERERRTIAADVHDGPVQDLAGVSYALGALRLHVPAGSAERVDQLASVLQHAIGSLRRLMVDIYPPDLSGAGLAAAVADLATPLRERGLVVSEEFGAVGTIAPETAAAVYRTAKETLTNVAQHAAARSVWVRLEADDLAGLPAVRLEVADDGVGLPATGTDRRAEGHLGLRLLADRAADLGGWMTLGERPGGGTQVTAVFPADHTR